MTTDLILGTAGHIDHGKTSLIHALTGVDCDRLPEEVERGITIELGFAQLMLGDYRLGIVDVPGHERFVRNMLAGATGMDVVLLVVAADDSVKPQTREHLEILKLLNFDTGVIAVTKCDLVEPEWIEMVEEEIRELVADTVLEDAPIVRTSAETRQGTDDLREQLALAAAGAAGSQRMRLIDAPFRMAIDRSFTVAGYGTVVTGSVNSGRTRVGDELAIEPGGLRVRVRGVQNHTRVVDEVHRGQRAAVNLVGIRHDEIRRGQELSSPGHLVPSRVLTVSLSLLDAAPRPLKNRSRVRVHVGTAELLGRVLLLDRDKLEPGQDAPAQLLLNESAVSIWGQPFVVRSESPVTTIGGGRVLNPNAQRLPRRDPLALSMLKDLESSESIRRASAALYFAGVQDWKAVDLARTAGIENTEQIGEELAASGDLREIAVSPTRTVRLHRLLFEQLADRVEKSLRKLHEQNPLRSTLDRNQLANRFRYLGDNALFNTILDDLSRAKRIRLSERGVALVGQGPKLSQNERKLLAELIEMFRQAGIESPSVKQCQQQAAKNQQAVPQLIALAAADGDLVELASGYHIHAEVDHELKASLRERLANGKGATLSEIRELLNTTRKYAVPYCEYLDRTGFTRRDGDLRYLARLDVSEEKADN
ncbi:MAG: selenocysteine-specific translation elongation factor [Planctomycetes bacterium]|nr:selenocysteine-specific translation elongation factor [Planctomycetota bacterium]